MNTLPTHFFSVMKLAIVGSRNFVNVKYFNEKLDEILKEEGWNQTIEYVVSGGARGADHLAEIWAKQNNIKTLIFKPDWKNLGKKAGILRNTDIINAATHVIAFPTSSSIGTWDSIRKAQKRKLPLKIINV